MATGVLMVLTIFLMENKSLIFLASIAYVALIGTLVQFNRR